MMPLCAIPSNKHRYRTSLTQSFHPLFMGQHQSMPIAAAPTPSSVDAPHSIYQTFLPQVLLIVLCKRDLVALAAQYVAHPSHSRRERKFWNAFRLPLDSVLKFLDEVNIEATFEAFARLGLDEPQDYPSTQQFGAERDTAASSYDSSSVSDGPDEYDVRRAIGETISSVTGAHRESCHQNPRGRRLGRRKILIHMRCAWFKLHVNIMNLQRQFFQHGPDCCAGLAWNLDWVALRDGIFQLEDGLLREASMLAEAREAGRLLLVLELYDLEETRKTR